MSARAEGGAETHKVYKAEPWPLSVGLRRAGPDLRCSPSLTQHSLPTLVLLGLLASAAS